MRRNPDFDFRVLNAELDEMDGNRSENSEMNPPGGVDNSVPTESTYLSDSAPPPTSGASVSDQSLNTAFNESSHVSEPLYLRAAHPSHIRRDVTMMNGMGDIANQSHAGQSNIAAVRVVPLEQADPLVRFIAKIQDGEFCREDLVAYAQQNAYARAEQLLLMIHRQQRVINELETRIERLEDKPTQNASTQTNGAVEEDDDDEIC